MRMHNGAPVEPDAAGCCVGLTGVGEQYAPCVSDVTTAGTLTFVETAEVRLAYSCDRHAVVLEAPRPLTIADMQELDRRRAIFG